MAEAVLERGERMSRSQVTLETGRHVPPVTLEGGPVDWQVVQQDAKGTAKGD